jgi:hypothetical protein
MTKKKEKENIIHLADDGTVVDHEDWLWLLKNVPAWKKRYGTDSRDKPGRLRKTKGAK